MVALMWRANDLKQKEQGGWPNPCRGCYGVSLRCVTVRTKGVPMDSLVMFIIVMVVILLGGIVVYKKGL
jgi:hypothetical protein